jgi:dUTPase
MKQVEEKEDLDRQGNLQDGYIIEPSQIRTLDLVNNSDNDFTGKKGDRIAQLILEKISTPDVMVVSELSDTSRGSGGFGSTGK